MRSATVITVVLSVGLHVGLATGLVAVAQKRELRRRAISVAVHGREEEAEAHQAARAAQADRAPGAGQGRHRRRRSRSPRPMAPRQGRGGADGHEPQPCRTPASTSAPASACRGAPQPRPAAPVKVASAISERAHAAGRARRPAAGDEAPCEEEPTKPEADRQDARSTTRSIRRRRPTASRGSSRRGSPSTPDGEVADVTVLRGIEPGLRRRDRRGAQALALQARDGLRQAGRGRHVPFAARRSSSATRSDETRARSSSRC